MSHNPPSTAWIGICTVLGLGAVAVAGANAIGGGAIVDPLTWRAAHWPEQPWSWWTSAWVHNSAGSLAGNLLALAALAVAGAALQARAASAAALFVAWPLAALGLPLWPGVSHYSGLGGPLHAAAMVLWAHLALRPAHKPLSFVLFAAMGLKLSVERAWLQPVAFDPSWGLNVVYAAHLTGAVAGACCGVAAEGMRRFAERAAP